MEEKKNFQDGESNLPDHIRHNILSLLKPKEAAKTCILSKAWLSACRTRPNLHFIFENFRLSADNPVVARRCSDFINCINNTLLRYHENKYGIDSLQLNFNGHKFPTLMPHQVETWLQIAVANGVKSLDFDISNSSMWTATIFEAKSLVELCLSGKPLLKLHVIKLIRCDGLRKLFLIRVDLDEVMLDRIISSCPLIEILEISGCVGLVNVKVTNLQKLKQFSIDFGERAYVEIEAPSLEDFSCATRPLYIQQPPVGLQIYTSKILKRLFLYNVDINNEFVLGMAENFPHLEELTIHRCQSLQTIKISSQSIKCISLVENWLLQEVRIDVPSIVRFVCKANFTPLLSVTAPSGGWDSDITLSCNYSIRGTFFLDFFSELEKFLTELHKSEISLHITFPRPVGVGFIEDKMRNSAIFPVPRLQKLSIGFWEQDCLDAAYLVLDGIFWTCRPKTIVQLWQQGSYSYPNKNDVVKVLFEMLVLRNNQKDGTLKQTKFWQQDLKDVKLEIFNKSQRVHCLELLDWKTFLNLIEDEGRYQRTFLVFSLDWETDMTRKRKSGLGDSAIRQVYFW